MSDNVCCFCLGDSSDIPPFGNTFDAQDFVNPCGTCSLQAHRRCLLEWYNCKGSSKLVRGDITSIAAAVSRGDISVDEADSDEEAPGNGGANFSTFDRDLRIQVEDSTIRNWLANLFNQQPLVPPTNIPSELAMNEYVLLRCPQCKKQLVFSTKRSGALDSLASMRVALECGATIAGLTMVGLGVVSVGIVGLASWGTNIMSYIIPGQLQVPLLSKRYHPLLGGFGSASAYSSFINTNSLDKALDRGVIGPLRVAHVPFLPIIMYMLPSTSVVGLFEKKGEDRVHAMMHEFIVSSYISSLGGHELIRQVWRNVKRLGLGRSSSASLNLFAGVDFWSTGVMISMLVPARWTYDVLFRLVFSRAHLEVTKVSSPREISNHLSPELATTLEELNALEVQQQEQFQVQKKLFTKEAERRWSKLPKWVRQFTFVGTLCKKFVSGLFFTIHCFLSPLMRKHIKTRVVHMLYKLKASFAHDFSTSAIGGSTILKFFSILMWPILSGELGKIVSKVMAHYVKNTSSDKITLLSNFVSLVLVVVIKDCFDLYIARKRAEQAVNLQIIDTRKARTKSEAAAEVLASGAGDTDDQWEELPGAYRR